MSVKYLGCLEKELKKRFEYHAPLDENQKGRYEEIRENGKNFARVVSQRCPESRELALAFTKIEEAIFWANAAIARNEVEEV